LIGRPIDWDTFFLIMAISFSLVWATYPIILLGYVFLVEGRRKKISQNIKKKITLFFIQIRNGKPLEKLP
jgi:hypothetical protein